MKKIIIIHTGGTIGSSAEENERSLNRDSSVATRKYLIREFARGNSPYAKNADLLVDSSFSWENTTLSENMTVEKLSRITEFLGRLPLEDYAGVILLHGTDTLAYTAGILSFAFPALPVPLIMVSGDRPPMDPLSNANDNFRTAVELIWKGIAPHVYVTYRNSDGKNRLFLGSSLISAENYTADFRISHPDKDYVIGEDREEELFAACEEFSKSRRVFSPALHKVTRLCGDAMLIRPYTGLDYAVYASAIDSGRYRGVVHGTYHSGTVCHPGLVLFTEARKLREQAEHLSGEEMVRLLEKADRYAAMANEEASSSRSIRYLSECCRGHGMPLFVAPSALGKDQYETMNIVVANTCAVLLNMTTEAAYAKLTVGLSAGLSGEELVTYMQTPVASEMQ